MKKKKILLFVRQLRAEVLSRLSNYVTECNMNVTSYVILILKEGHKKKLANKINANDNHTETACSRKEQTY